MEIEIGDPESWVHVTPFGPSQNGVQVCAGLAVRCDHCGGTSSTYLPYLRKHPDTVKRMVEQHNACARRAAA